MMESSNTSQTEEKVLQMLKEAGIINQGVSVQEIKNKGKDIGEKVRSEINKTRSDTSRSNQFVVCNDTFCVVFTE